MEILGVNKELGKQV